MNQREEYVLQWLDMVIHLSLNPNRNQMELSEPELEKIRQRAIVEIDNQRAFLHRGLLSLNNKKKLRTFVDQYYYALVILLDQCHINLSKTSQNHPRFQAACEAVTECVQQLIGHVKDRFGKLFSSQTCLPVSYSEKLKNEIKSRINILGVRFNNIDDLPDLVWKILHLHADLQSPILSGRQAFYIKELISKLEKIQPQAHSGHLYPFLEVLIQLNFNDPLFIKFYTRHVAELVNTGPSPMDKINMILLCKKEFNQVYINPRMRLHEDAPPLNKTISYWFKQELVYLMKSEVVFPAPSHVMAIKQTKQPPMFKVLCSLSADQIGVMLRAMDELKIIQAKSLSAVFEHIVPFLATPQRQNISWQSVRSKSYSVEENDRKIIIATLESMISFIREY